MSKAARLGPIAPPDDHLNLRRNRQIAFAPTQVRTDGMGNITYRPLVRPPLPCFALPHRYWRGELDKPVRWIMSNGTTKEEPHGCFGCRVRAACGKVAWERVNTSPTLKRLHDAWESETQRLPLDDRYAHDSWAAFDESSRAHRWLDSHNDALALDKEKRAAREKQRRKEQRVRQRKARPITPAVLSAISYERGRRTGVLLALRTAQGAPRYVSRLSPEGCQRTADVWAARELLERGGHEVTGKAVAMLLVQEGKGEGVAFSGLITRSLEALKRIDRLESDMDGLPIWSPFSVDPLAP